MPYDAKALAGVGSAQNLLRNLSEGPLDSSEKLRFSQEPPRRLAPHLLTPPAPSTEVDAAVAFLALAQPDEIAPDSSQERVLHADPKVI